MAAFVILYSSIGSFGYSISEIYTLAFNHHHDGRYDGEKWNIPYTREKYYNGNIIVWIILDVGIYV